MGRKKTVTEMQPAAQETTERKPDCVTQVRRGNRVITARGFFNTVGKETALDKIERMIRIEGEASGF